MSETRLVVVGIGADGWASLSEHARSVIVDAEVVLGGARQLSLLPDVVGGRRSTWPRPLRAGLRELLDTAAGARVVALASGDPLRSGIGTVLIELLGPDGVVIVPHISSEAWARARMGWSAESTAVVSVVGRDVEAIAREFAPGRRIVVLSSDENTPAAVAALLVEHGCPDSRLTVLADLGSSSEQRWDLRAGDLWSATAGTWDFPRLNLVAILVAGPFLCGWATGLPDEVFDNDGQLTKRDLRASALARLMPAPGQLLWDVGAGAGSVGIEWMRSHPTCRTIAVESDAVRAQHISKNSRRLGVPALAVVNGRAPQALADLPPPDAVFVGGGATREGVLEACMAVLLPGGRLVVHGVTLETEMLLAEAYRVHGGELTRIGIERAAPVGSFTGWTPARSVVQWALGPLT